MGFIQCLAQANNLCVNDNSFSDADSKPDILHGVVINMTWAQLEPTRGVFDNRSIDEALDRIARYNIKHPEHGLRAILRVESASVAPDWVKGMSGGPIPVLYRTNNKPITIPVFWTDEYRAAWRRLQAELAAKYDADPLIAQISDTSCSHQTDEPYVNPIDSASILAMFTTGYTNQKYEACLLDSVHDYDAWHRTRVDFTQNPFEQLSVKTVDGEETGVYGPVDLGTTVMVMKAFRDALGERAVISNHNLRSPPFAGEADLYPVIEAIGQPIEFQTASPGVLLPDGQRTGNLPDWDTAIQLGVDLGATAIEVWPTFVFKGNPINDGWNPGECAADVPPSECSGQPREELIRWNDELETGNKVSPL